VDDETFLPAAMTTLDQVLVTGNTTPFAANLYVPLHILSPVQALELLALL
jgi:hypothetical protein